MALYFQHRFRHLFDEQRNAIGALYNVLTNVRWHWLVASHSVDQPLDFTPRQPIEREGSDVWLSNPRRLELGPKGYDQQNVASRSSIYSPTEYL
jgi:hypothetical protein